jgi:hypothetical protein
VSVGFSMMRETYVFLRGGQVLQAALRSGITRIGMASAIGAVVLVLVALVYWLTVINPKKLLGMIISGTRSTLIVKNWRAGVDGGRGSDLFMQHGSMNSFMQDYEAGDLSKKIDGAYEIAHMFAVPYYKDNGTNVAFVRGPFPDLEWLFPRALQQTLDAA